MDAARKDMILAAVCANWNNRAQDQGLKNAKTKAYQGQQEAFIQGALAALVAAGILGADEYRRIGFLCAIGRLDEWVQARAIEAPTEQVPA